jgi:hypothetical protein
MAREAAVAQMAEVGALKAAPRRLAMLSVRNRQTNRILVNVTSADKVSLITLARVLAHRVLRSAVLPMQRSADVTPKLTRPAIAAPRKSLTNIQEMSLDHMVDGLSTRFQPKTLQIKAH